MTTKEIQARLNLRYEPIAFRSIERAHSFASRCGTAMWVVLGDIEIDGEVEQGVAWVVCPADAARLERAGYEIA